jgi:hypothetical protein
MLRRFIQKHQKWAIDERCQCGHPRTEHGILMSQIGEVVMQQDGLGRCQVSDCHCDKFRRHGWVFEDEPPSTGR